MMYRHVSLYTLENKEDIPTMKAMLEEVGNSDPRIRLSVVRENCTDGTGEEASFADIVQMLHFANHKDLDAYAHSEGHEWLISNAPKCTVNALDYRIDID